MATIDVILLTGTGLLILLHLIARWRARRQAEALLLEQQREFEMCVQHALSALNARDYENEYVAWYFSLAESLREE